MRRLLFVCFVWAVFASAAQADTITVDTTADALDASGDCSLREAVEASNSDTAVDGCAAGDGADTVVVPAGTYVLTLGSTTDEDDNQEGDLDVHDSVVIEGAGADAVTIQLGHEEGNVIEVPAVGVALTVRGVTVTGMAGTAAGASAGITVLRDATSLLVEDCAFVHLEGRENGGGIATLTRTTVRRTSFEGNPDYGIWWRFGTLAVSNSTFSGNGNGGIWIGSGEAATVDHCTFVDNGQAGLVDAATLPTLLPTIDVRNSVFAGPHPSVRERDSRFVSLGGNVSWDAHATWGLIDIRSTDPMLGPLGEYGGPSRTHLPAPGSAAAGFSDCRDGSEEASTVDQRGAARPARDCTAGAVEGPSCGNGFLEPPEGCEEGECCTATCAFAETTEVCRPATGACDAAEACTGASASCPPDLLEDADTVCRPAAAACDAAETCTGESASCPPESTPIEGCCAMDAECDDGDPCTTDACGASSTCVHDVVVSCGAVDAGAGGPETAGGCGCRAAGGSSRGVWLLALLAVVVMPWRRRRGALKGALLACAIWAASTGAAHAATIAVDTTVDAIDEGGDCSLREAVQAANTDRAVDACPAGDGVDTIVVPPGTYVLSLGAAEDEDANAGGDLDLLESVVLEGAGADAVTIQLDHAEGNVIEASTADVALIVRGVTFTGMGGSRNGESAGITIIGPGSSVLVEDCAFVHLPGRSGGIGLFTNGPTTVRRTLFDGIELYGIWWLSGLLEVTNSTFSGNGVSGIAVLTDGVAAISHCTFVDNGTAALQESGSGERARVLVRSSIFAGPHQTLLPSATSVVTRGGNVVWDTHSLFGPDDLQSTDPMLGSLGDNAGPTHTYMPSETSAAVGFGDCGHGTRLLAVDQRGAARPGSACTAGAAERPFCGNGLFEDTEACDGEPCCTTSCTLAGAGVVCRDAAGGCDVDEQCTGESASCPEDRWAEAGAVCRPATDACDVVEQCTGESTSCPSDSTPIEGCCTSDAACDDGDACTLDSCDPGSSMCSHAAVEACRDASTPGHDGGPGLVPTGGGCGCRAGGATRGPWIGVPLIGLALWRRRRRRGTTGGAPRARSDHL